MIPCECVLLDHVAFESRIHSPARSIFDLKRCAFSPKMEWNPFRRVKGAC